MCGAGVVSTRAYVLRVAVARNWTPQLPTARDKRQIYTWWQSRSIVDMTLFNLPHLLLLHPF